MSSKTNIDRSAAAKKAAATRAARKAQAAAQPVQPTALEYGLTATVETLGEAAVISMRIVRETTVTGPQQIRHPSDGYALLRERYADADREILVVVVLDTKNRVLAVHPVYYGSVNAIAIRINEIFKAAIILGGAAIMVAHNHPSGDPQPSPEDVVVTRNLVQAGQLLDIEVVDHIVLGNNCYVSLRERGLGFNGR